MFHIGNLSTYNKKFEDVDRIEYLPSTPSTVLGRALRVECELVNVCACLND